MAITKETEIQVDRRRGERRLVSRGGPDRRRSTVGTSARKKIDHFAGLSRHGIVAAQEITQRPTPRTTVRKSLSLMGGSTLIGLGVSLYVHARLGVPAYDVMLTALRDRFDISHGQAGFAFTGLLYLLATVLGNRPRVSGLFYLLANSITVDLWTSVITDPDDLFTRMLFVVIGTAALASGIALVIHAGLTGGSIELLMNAGADRGMDRFRVRRGIEIAVVSGGVILGGDLGPATVFFVLAMSPMMKFGQQALQDHRSGREARLQPTWD